MTQKLIRCDFCNELSGNSENSFDQVYGEHLESRVLFRSDNFAVIPSMGHLLEGYLLVVPIRHFKTAGDLAGDYLEEFVTLCQRVGDILKDQYGSCIFFEHGTRSEGVGGCGIYHAHVHAIPLAGASDPIEKLKQKFPYAELVELNEISKRSAGLLSYLFYQDSVGRLYLFDTGPLPSQYMRKLLAEGLGEPDWNWRSAGREERLLATLRRLSACFESGCKSGNRDGV